MQSFLGQAPFFQYFVPNYSNLTSDLSEKTRKEFNWKGRSTWRKDYEAIFESLKLALMDSNLLRCTIPITSGLGYFGSMLPIMLVALRFINSNLPMVHFPQSIYPRTSFLALLNAGPLSRKKVMRAFSESNPTIIFCNKRNSF